MARLANCSLHNCNSRCGRCDSDVLVNYQEYVDQHISSGNGENSLEDALGALAFAILLVIPFAVQIIVSGLLIVCLIVAMSSMASRGYARKRDVVGMIVCKYIFLVPSILIFVLFFTRYSIPMFIMHALVIGTLIFDYIYPVDDCVDAFKEAKTVKAKVQETVTICRRIRKATSKIRQICLNNF